MKIRIELSWGAEIGDGLGFEIGKTTEPVAEFNDDARAYFEFHLTPSVAIEPRDHQQEAHSAWRGTQSVSEAQRSIAGRADIEILEIL